MSKKILKDVTLVIVDCVNFERAKLSLDHCSACCDFGAVKFLTHFDAKLDPRIVNIPQIKSIAEYSKFIVKDLANYFDTTHVLIIQWDGFIINPDKWTDDFLRYDYIGAPWWVEALGEGVPRHYLVGNGGFSLRSRKLQMFLRDASFDLGQTAEDVLIGQVYRAFLEESGFTFAPQEVASQFSYESDPVTDSFGCHARQKLTQVKLKNSRGKVYDCFLYNGEAKMLNFRLQELESVVDMFIIGESTHTFKGDPRKLTLKEDLKKIDPRFLPKIRYVVYDQPPVANPWDNERYQRNSLEEALPKEMGELDLIMLSDVDEIPNVDWLDVARSQGFIGIAVFSQDFYYYNFKCLNQEKWNGTEIFNHGSGYMKLGFEQLRKNRWHLPIVKGGWHLSYFGDVASIISKIKSFSHQEFNQSKYTDPGVIEECIKNGTDLFGRPNEKWQVVVLDEMPRPKFAHLLED